MKGSSDILELAIASCMLEVGEPRAAYAMAVGVLHKVGGRRLCDETRKAWEGAQSVAGRAMLQPWPPRRA